MILIPRSAPEEVRIQLQRVEAKKRREGGREARAHRKHHTGLRTPSLVSTRVSSKSALLYQWLIATENGSSSQQLLQPLNPPFGPSSTSGSSLFFPPEIQSDERKTHESSRSRVEARASLPLVQRRSFSEELCWGRRRRREGRGGNEGGGGSEEEG